MGTGPPDRPHARSGSQQQEYTREERDIMNDQRPTQPVGRRRDFLKGSAAAIAVAAAYGLRPELGLAQDVPNQFDGSNFQLKPTEPNAKHGGVLKAALFSRQPHFDIHQSGTFGNTSTMSCMFDNLIRRDPRDGKSIIPDLAHSWDISKDGTSYTFFLRKDVQFHDGAELTSADVKATFDRIVNPPSGISIPRSALFTAVSEIRAPDKYTVEFKLSEPRSVNFIMSSIATGWNVIVRKKTLEDNNGNLRRVLNYPGTGPFNSVRRVENEVWVFERNKNYWNKGLPYLDGLEFYHALPFSPEMSAALLGHRVDYVRVTDPGTIKRVKATPGMLTAEYYQADVQGVWVNNKHKPFDDPRVRRALHLVLDRPVLVEVVKDIGFMMEGGFIYPFSDFATPKDELSKRIGYQSDPAAAIKEARALMAAAGHANGLKGQDLLTRDFSSLKLWAQALQAMLQETLNIQCNLRTTVESVWFDDAKSGNYDLALGIIVSTLLDPSDYFRAWYSPDGPQNYSFWNNPKFNALLPQIDREVDPAKRLALIRQAEAIMEDDPPLLPIAWEKVNDAWYDYVKGIHPEGYFGLYDVNRYDIAWLDK
jgi:peptide/nickel transport system substrate-binding protein